MEADNGYKPGEIKAICHQVCHGVSSCGFGDEDNLLFVFMAHLFVENNDGKNGFHDLDDIFDDNEIPSWVFVELHRESELLEKELSRMSMKTVRHALMLFNPTDVSKEEPLCELNINEVGNPVGGLINAR